MIAIKPTEEQIEFAEEETKRILNRPVSQTYFAKYFPKDIPREKIYNGMLAEVCVRDYFGSEKRYDDCCGFDGGFDLEYGGLKIEIKTRHSTFKPKDNYEYKVPARQIRYPSKFFIFCNYHTPSEMLYIVGDISKVRFDDRARLVKAGTVEPQQGFT
jgi:hypothetical protein